MPFCSLRPLVICALAFFAASGTGCVVHEKINRNIQEPPLPAQKPFVRHERSVTLNIFRAPPGGFYLMYGWPDSGEERIGTLLVQIDYLASTVDSTIDDVRVRMVFSENVEPYFRPAILERALYYIAADEEGKIWPSDWRMRQFSGEPSGVR